MSDLVLGGVHLAVCGECHALTHASDAGRHEDWHEEQAEAARQAERDHLERDHDGGTL